MLTRMEYTVSGGGAVVYRCYGTGEYLEIPEAAGEYPVIGLWDHCFASSPSAAADRGRLRTFVPDTAAGADDSGEMCGERLKRIVLPRGLEFTGDYAFYGCRSLTHLTVPSSLKRLGGGNFVACNHIRVLEFEMPEGEGFATPFAMRDVIGEVTYEVEARLVRRAAGREGRQVCRLLFPGYIEDSKENTPARIIEIKYEGMGYQYRQCFQGRELDLHQYDSLFPLTRAQELFQTSLSLALCRLCTPEGLGAEAEKTYVSWLTEHAEAAAEAVLSAAKEDAGCLETLRKAGFFTPPVLSMYLERASAAGHAAAVSEMLRVREGQTPPSPQGKGGRRKRYTLS